MSTLTLNLDDRHDAALTSLAVEQELSKTALLRTALRLYQAVHNEVKRGRQLAFQNADGSFVSMVMLGGPMAAELASPHEAPAAAGAAQAAAEVVSNDICQDHEGRIEAFQFLPVGTKLYDLAATPAPEPYQKALDIRIAQGWQLGGNACPVLYTDTINGEQVRRDDLWLATTAGLKGTPEAAQPIEREDGK